MKRLCKSTLASIFISLGVYALLATNYSYLSMILFALGLYSICLFNLNLFTGKCGYTFLSKCGVSVKEALLILFWNLVAGYILGLLYSLTSPEVVSKAISVVSKWHLTREYFIRACMCGAIMFLAVHTYKKGSSLGIFFGIPLFILCGFQHCIANVVIMGCARAWSPALISAILGNWLGSVVIQKLMEKSDVL